MRAPPISQVARLRLRHRHCLAIFISLLISLLFDSSLASAVTSAQGKSVQPLHGLGYEHLDCSACITVARALFNRINKTLAESPSTYLISHRLGKQNELRRRQYRNSELLVSEVMENVCTSYGSDEPLLRLHPKSKVRLYHQQVFGDVRLGVRHALREDEFYPADADPAAWADKGSMHRYPIAKLYSRKDAEALRGLQSRHAAPTMCALLVEEFEDEIEELVKAARTLAETEYGLCGMELPPKLSSPTLNGGTEGDNGSSVPLITNVCADVEVLRAAAHRDQQRWAQYQLREEKRKARRTQRKERETGGTATSVPATEASTQVGESNLHDSSAAPGANLMDSPPEEALHTSLASGVEKDAGDHTNDDL
ncbi:hypothetical protein JKF63_02563 [Porcisia hertigi]|uniref:DUF3456 domain-containing protein n=1 Tax=Porcisia hertigi TaxID=2761500 RepID=A0A836I174_9TRYP|nr:hypothetical protein JKF63_02563 [Porcisia hertigi]